MARGQPTFIADGHPVQEMVERPEVAPAQAGHFGEKLGRRSTNGGKTNPMMPPKLFNAPAWLWVLTPCKHKGATTDEVVLKVMTVALLMHS